MSNSSLLFIANSSYKRKSCNVIDTEYQDTKKLKVTSPISEFCTDIDGRVGEYIAQTRAQTGKVCIHWTLEFMRCVALMFAHRLRINSFRASDLWIQNIQRSYGITLIEGGMSPDEINELLRLKLFLGYD
mmetsp:Transcript_22630/g.33085  ORF Transcript_22630/g.33085 Transcript_22630/m.33085 type:complete len:130 (-) Transcript_22630:242-631(-)